MVKKELLKIKEEVSYQKYPDELLIIRNIIMKDALTDYRDKGSIPLPDGVKEMTESGCKIVELLNKHFTELKESSLNENAALRMREHVIQVLTLLLQMTPLKLKEYKGIKEKCMLISTLMYVLEFASQQCYLTSVK